MYTLSKHIYNIYTHLYVCVCIEIPSNLLFELSRPLTSFSSTTHTHSMKK